MNKITSSDPDREEEFQIVIRVSIGAEGAEKIRRALLWSLPERRLESGFDETPYLDTYWDGKTNAAAQVGHSADMLQCTRWALRDSMYGSSFRVKEISRAIRVLESAIALSCNAKDALVASDGVTASLSSV